MRHRAGGSEPGPTAKKNKWGLRVALASTRCWVVMRVLAGDKGELLFSGRPRFGSVRLRFGDGTVQFRFSVPAVPLQKGFFCISVQFNRKGRFRFRFLENGSGGSGSAFGFGTKRFRRFRFRFRFLSHPVFWQCSKARPDCTNVSLFYWPVVWLSSLNGALGIPQNR